MTKVTMTETYNRNNSSLILILLFLVVLLVPVWAILTTGAPTPRISIEEQGMTLEDVIVPPFHLTVNSAGDVEVPLPTDGAGLPDCGDLGMPGCRWESKLQRTVSGEDTVIETNLTRDGRIVGKAQIMEVETAQYEELQFLSDMGHEKAWISFIRVARAYRGQGLGRALWQANDSMLKVLVGSGNAVRILVDTAGWGEALMKDVPARDVILALHDYWAYIVR